MKLAIKELLYSKKKFLLVELVLVLMIFMVMFLSGLANGLARAVSAGIENMKVSYFILSDDAEKLINVSTLNTEVLQEARKTGEGKVEPLDIQRMNISRTAEGEKLDVTYMAIDPKGFLNPQAVSGQKLSEQRNTIVLDNAFQEDGIRIGDVVKDSATGTGLLVVGFVKDQMLAHSPLGFISTETYTGLKQAINPGYLVKYHAIAVQGGTKPVLKSKGVEVLEKADIINHLPGYSAEQMTIRMILWVLVFITAAVLGVFFYIITLQKRSEFGVMKAIGIRMGEIAGIQLSQVLMLAIAGILLGNLLAFGMSAMLPGSMPFYLKATDAAGISLVFAALSAVSSLLSIQRISKVDPIMILGGN